MVKMVKQLFAVQHSQYPTSIPFFWQIWRYSFIEIFPSLNGSAESKIAVKAKCVDVKWIYFREQEYVHYLFCLYPRGFFSPSVSARPQTPFWLTADSTMMKEKVERLILLKLSQKYYLNQKQEPTLLISLYRSSSNSAFVFQAQKFLSGTIEKCLSNTTGKIPAHTEYRYVSNWLHLHEVPLTKSKSVFVFVVVFFVPYLCYVSCRGLWRVQQQRQPLHAVLTEPGIIDASRHPTNKSIIKVWHIDSLK